MWMIIMLLIALLVLATIAMEIDSFGWATLSLTITVAAVQLFHLANFLGFVREHAVLTALYAGGYVAMGVVWSFVKWFVFLFAFREKFREAKDNQLRAWQQRTGSESSAKMPNDWVGKSFLGMFRGNDLARKPQVTNNKARIVAWMAYWPCSVVGTVFNDPIRRPFIFLFNAFKGAYQEIVDRMFVNDKELK